MIPSYNIKLHRKNGMNAFLDKEISSFFSEKNDLPQLFFLYFFKKFQQKKNIAKK